MCYNSKTSLCVWAIVFFVIAAALIALTIAFPFIVNNLATKSVQLTSDNQDTWANIPGTHDLRVNRDYYLYDCTNSDEMYFAGAKPECTEIGPISFYENSTYVDAQYGKLEIPGENGKSKDSVNLNYQLNLLSYPETFDLDKNISIVNQALFGLWYGAGNQASFSLATSGLFNVWQGFANDAVTAIVALTAQISNINDQATFNASLASTSLTDEQKVALWNDPIYGVSIQAPNALKSGKLHYSICQGNVPEADRVRIQSELRTYFGMNWQQYFGWYNYWCNADTGIGQTSLLIFQTPCNSTVTASDFRTRCAFAQWAAANVTKAAGYDSLALVDQSVLGYPEMNYYQQQKVLNDTLKTIDGTIYENQFENVDFKDEKHIELFNYLSNKESSLFYYSTMRTLMQMGESYDAASNVITQDGKKYLDLSHFQGISQTLQLTLNQTYLLYKYLDELNNKSLLRSSEFPGTNHGAILGLANFVTQTLAQLIDSLYNYLLPRGLYGILSYLSIASQQQTCENLATTYFNNPTVQTFICGAGNEVFGINTTKGALFWTQAYLDRSSTINATLAQFGITPDLLTNFYSDAGNYGVLLDGVMKSVKSQYSQYCATGLGPYCVDSELGLAQFAASAITLNLPSSLAPLGLTNTPTVLGFAQLLGQTLPVPPEYAVFASRQGKPFKYDYLEALNNYQKGLTVKYVQDWFFAQNTETNPYDNSVWRDYLRYITIEIAFNGLFIKHTPREVLHGYKDPLITKIKETPIYAGGDPTQTDILSIIGGETSTAIAFFTGTDDYKYTKVYAEYNGQPTIKIKAPYRVGDGSTAQTVLVSPWREEIPLQGTDASTFPPLLEEDKSIWAFVSDIMIPLRFLYKGTSTKYGLEAFRYELDPEMLLKGDENERNRAFYLDKYDGFANMTSLRGAKLFACQPHFFGVELDLKDKEAVILDAVTGKEINPSHDNDQSYFFLEQTSGGQMEGYQKLQINVLMENDPLFNMTGNSFDYFVPVVYADRYTDLSEDQVNELFGALKVAKSLKTFLFCAGPVLAVVFIALGIWFLVKRRNMSAGPTGEYKEVP